MNEVVQSWVKKAENDLKNATHTLKMGDDCPYDTVCFHAQQAAEKYIKALLTYFSVDFPKSHDIGELISLLSSHVVLNLEVEGQERLTDYATTSRYPGDEALTRSDAEDALTLAKKVKAEVLNVLQK